MKQGSPVKGYRRTVAAVVFVLLGACTHTYRTPDLGGLYNRAAQGHHSSRRNPIVVIPGILGSKLVESGTGREVWGAFGGGAANPARADGARLVALPMADGVGLGDLRDNVYPHGVLDRIKARFLGLPLQLKAYLQIIATLGAGGYRDEALGLSGAIDYGDEHFTCFQFDYDWRRDNVENAGRLHRFLLEKRAYVIEESRRRFGRADENVRFDVVAHSMGALLTRYYLRYGDAELQAEGPLPPVTWAGSRLVERVVLIGPPNAGSVAAVLDLVEGRKFGFTLPRYQPAVVGTFPSLYQLLPRSRHRPLVWDDERQEPVSDLLSPELWQRLAWGLASRDQDRYLAWLLPEVTDPKERRRLALDHQRKCLERARRFVAALDRPASPPPELELYLMAGDARRTLQSVAVNPQNGRVRALGWRPGDGSVLRSSALMDERLGGSWSPTLASPIDWKSILFLFSDHLGMTRDPAFSDNVLYLLLEDPRRHRVAPSSGVGNPLPDP